MAFCFLGVPVLPERGPCFWLGSARMGLAVVRVPGEFSLEMRTGPRGLFDRGVIAMLVSFEHLRFVLARRDIHVAGGAVACDRDIEVA